MRLRKWVAEQYDQRGRLARPYRRTNTPGAITFTNINNRELTALKKPLEQDGMHTAMWKITKTEEGETLSIARQKDVIVLCVYIYPYLQVQWKREQMVETWRELGWCICDSKELNKRP